MADQIYLDYNATTPVEPEVVDAMMPWFTEKFGNPSSSHGYGRAAKQAVDRARGQVASLLGCASEEVISTSGGTESNNLAIFGTAGAAPKDRRGIVTSEVEHPAVARPCDRLEREGYSVTRMRVDGTGRIHEAIARTAVDGRTAPVTVMLANNETGTLMPIRNISRMRLEPSCIPTRPRRSARSRCGWTSSKWICSRSRATSSKPEGSGRPLRSRGHEAAAPRPRSFPRAMTPARHGKRALHRRLGRGLRDRRTDFGRRGEARAGTPGRAMGASRCRRPRHQAQRTSDRTASEHAERFVPRHTRTDRS